MPVVSITRLHVRSLVYFPAFLVRTTKSARQAARSEGVLAVRLLRDRRFTFWTSTVWSSESSMKAFMHAKPHGPIMRTLLDSCDEAALVHWTQPDADLPSWDVAHTRLEQEGRPSKVNHPSTAHKAHKFPAPTVSRSRELRVK